MSKKFRILSHRFVGAASSNYFRPLARTEVVCHGTPLVFVRFDQGRVEVYRIEDGLEMFVGYLSAEADEAFAGQLYAWRQTARNTTPKYLPSHVSVFS